MRTAAAAGVGARPAGRGSSGRWNVTKVNFGCAPRLGAGVGRGRQDAGPWGDGDGSVREGATDVAPSRAVSGGSDGRAFYGPESSLPWGF
ncbi:hypothetical protein GCM10007977_045720 [Dactylosporangium sucinum]|uniref:Uncharacterized protein n=1 Tax=Dactylosporangium sucinum TaxID=1424081 RepID=A0A917WXH5_9ACTN|nr:hypothetical protein GCM10007977_045720 [Dactylosporangium sucinum]